MNYIVEKAVNGIWYFEGEGPISYVNRIIPYMVQRGMVFRLIEVSETGTQNKERSDAPYDRY